MDYFELIAEQAERFANKTCVIVDDIGYSYERLYADASVLAWRSPLHGAAVLVQARNLYAQLTAFIGLQGAGCVPILGHFDMPKEAVLEMMRRNGVAYLWLAAGEPRINELVPVDARPAEDTLGVQDASFTETAGSEFYELPGVTPARLRPAVCMGVLSSGSSSMPKVMYRTYASWGDFFAEQNRMFCIDADAVVFMEGSLSFTGNLSTLAGALAAGATSVLASDISYRVWARSLKLYAATVLYMVPVKLRFLTRHAKEEFPQVRMVFAGSQLVDDVLARRLKKCFPNMELVLYYGASELDYITWLTYDELLAHPLSVGRPCPGVKVTVRDGLIFVDTPYHVEGIQLPYTLKDMGYFTPDGYLMFEGRTDGVVNKGGFKINLLKVETALSALPGIQDAAVLPVPAGEGKGSEIVAFVVAGDSSVSFPPKKLREQLAQTLMPQELPKRFIMLDEIPLNSRGKRDNDKLRKLAAPCNLLEK